MAACLKDTEVSFKVFPVGQKWPKKEEHQHKIMIVID